MGEIAEMMLEGILCDGCGAFIDEHPPGHTRSCANCGPISLSKALKRPLISSNARKAERHNRERHAVAKTRKQFACGACQRLFRTPEGLAQHTADKHGEQHAV